MKAKVVKKVVKKTKSLAEKSDYIATAYIMGKRYQAKGKTASEAISKLDVGNCKGKCVLSVENGDKKRERVLMPSMSFRLFSLSKMMREIALKQIGGLFSDV